MGNIKLRIVKQSDGQFCVDDPSKTGSPPIGRGPTMLAAIGSFFHHNQHRFGIEFEVDRSALPTEMKRRHRENAKR